MPTSLPPSEKPSRRSAIRIGSGIAAAAVTGAGITGVMRGATAVSTRPPAVHTAPAGAPDPSVERNPTDHAYTTRKDLRDEFVEQGYSNDTDCSGKMYVFREEVIAAEATMARLYKLHQPTWHDHFYTPDEAERGKYLDEYGYEDVSDNDPMWILLVDDPSDLPPGAQLLRRLCSRYEFDTYYTASAEEAAVLNGRGYEPNDWPDAIHPVVFDTMGVVNGVATALWYRLYHPESPSPTQTTAACGMS